MRSGARLTLTVSATAPAGTYPLTIATDVSLGGSGKSITYQLTVDGEGAAPRADM